MKRILVVLMVALMTLGASAQERVRGSRMQRMNPTEQATAQAKRVKDRCQLTDEQYQKVYELYLAQANASKARRDSMEAARNTDAQSGATAQQGGGQGRERMMGRQKEFNDKMKAILNEEQYAKYEEMLKEGRRQNGNRRQGGGRRN